jgi:Domain of unknown function (DUF4388)
MSLAGYLSEYSLAEIFNFVQEGNKTGLLSIEPDRCLSRSLDNSYYISFQTGRIMSVSNGHGLEYRGLLKMMEQRRWLSPEQVTGLSINAHKLGQPLGTYLKSCNAIDSSQLRLLFDAQVTASICKLFGEIHHGRFEFDPQAELVYAEMTGLSLTAQEIALLGLRMLKDWSSLTTKLPAPESALQRLAAQPPDLRLDTQESNVWKLALGEMSIASIAAQLGLEIDRVQQIGFRLSSIGLVQEIANLRSMAEIVGAAPEHQPPIVDLLKKSGSSTANTPVSTSFLSKLIGFLNKKM